MISSIIIGALCGWIASMIMKTDAQMGAIANIVVGVIGGAIGSWNGKHKRIRICRKFNFRNPRFCNFNLYL